MRKKEYPPARKYDKIDRFINVLGEAMDKETSPSRLARISWSRDKQVIRFVAGNYSTSPRTLGRLARMHTDTDILGQIVGNPKTSEKTFRFIARTHAHRDQSLLVKMLRNPSCPHDLATKVCQNGEGKGRQAAAEYLAGSPETSRELLVEIYNSWTILYIRRALSRNPSTPEFILEEFAQNAKDRDILVGVADNPSASESLRVLVTMRVLSKDYDRFPSAGDLNLF